MLVAFLTSRDEQVRRSRYAAELPTIPELYNQPEVLAANPHFPRALEVFREGAMVRPSTVAGKMYPEVSRAYFEAVHAVLTHKKPASKAAADLEVELRQILTARESTSNVRSEGNGASQQ